MTMNKKIIPTAILDDMSENIGIASMTVRYTQRPDGNDPNLQDQFLTIDAVGYDDGDEESVAKGVPGHYLVLQTERWAIDDPKEMKLVLNDFFARLGVNQGLPLLKIADEVVMKRPHGEDEILERYIADNNHSQAEATRDETNLDPLEGIEFTDSEPDQQEEPDPKPKKTPKAPKPVDVLVDGGWVTFESANKAAQALGVSPAWLGKSLQLGKTCNGRHVRYSNPELDATFAEIKERDKQPYQISRP